MAGSTKAGPLSPPIGICRIPARTPGILGYMDQGDPTWTTLLGDTPGPLGWNDWASPMMSPMVPTIGTAGDGIPLAIGTARPEPVATVASAELSWEQIKIDMEEHEALVAHMYLDSVDKVTVGIGNMLPNLAAAQALAFEVRAQPGTAATREQIKADWDKVNANAGKNWSAKAYAAVTLLSLPQALCWSLLKTRIDDEFLPGVKGIFAGWDTLPLPVKRALLDMIYNLGKDGLKKFKKLIAAVEKGEWETAALQCHRSGIPDDRNEWTAARFREALPAPTVVQPKR